MRKAIVHERALLDLDELAAYIGEDSVEAAIRFLRAARSTVEMLQEHPYVGAVCDINNPRLVGVRVRSVSRFQNHLVFYRAGDSTVEIIRVLHAARDIDAAFEE